MGRGGRQSRRFNVHSHGQNFSTREHGHLRMSRAVLQGLQLCSTQHPIINYKQGSFSINYSNEVFLLIYETCSFGPPRRIFGPTRRTPPPRRTTHRGQAYACDFFVQLQYDVNTTSSTKIGVIDISAS